MMGILNEILKRLGDLLKRGRWTAALAVEPPSAALGNKNEDVRWQAVRGWRQLGEAAVSPLIAALHDADENLP
jgi:HEAT repeat protein